MALEERFGLSWLFWTRGPLEPPADVVVVSLDGASGERLGLAARLREWPRRLYAELIERLVEADAAVIVFDLRLDQARDAANDAALAQAIRDAGRVVLFEYLERKNRPMPGRGAARAGMFTTEQVHSPSRRFGRSGSRPRAVSPAQGAGAREPVLGVSAGRRADASRGRAPALCHGGP